MQPVPRGDQLDALIARAQQGDVGAFEALLEGHLGQVRRFARAFAASEADADDLAQEALVKIFRSLRLFRYQSAFSTWLYAVVRNVFLDATKSRAGRERAREEALEAAHTKDLPGAAQPDALLEQEQERRRLWRALRQVPAEFRTALVLFDIEGATYDEVAAIEGVPVGTVKSRLSRGREHLRRLVGNSEEGSGASSEARTGDEPGTSLEQASSNPARGPMRRGS